MTPMASEADLWYVRLPDGRTLRAQGVEVLRQSLGNGTIPWDSTVRRSGDQPWLPLGRVPELADLRPGDGAPRRRPDSDADLNPIGARAIVEALWNALDSSLHTRKLLPAALAGLVAAAAFIAAELSPLWISSTWLWLARASAGLVLILAVALCTSWVTQMTYIELARLRPARRRELHTGLSRYTLRLVAMQLLVTIAFAAPLLLLRWLSPQLASAPADSWLDGLRGCMLAARLLWEVFGWPIFVMSMLLVGPIVVVEDYPLLQTLRELLSLIRKHLARIYLYEVAAVVLGVVLTLPVLIPIRFAAMPLLAGQTMHQAEEATLSVLVGLASTPFFAYLLVANVFIYLNLRYEFRASA